MNSITFFAEGPPHPQPRHRWTSRGGRAIAYLPNDSPIHTWKKAIAEVIHHTGHAGKEIDSPVKIYATFLMPIPKYLKKLKVCHPHTKKQDIDNLAKAVFDVLTDTGVIKDDSLIVHADLKKHYSDIPGVQIQIEW